jgi:glutathione synthase/RimK-type ligase-like ATP-grasp enzyme
MVKVLAIVDGADAHMVEPLARCLRAAGDVCEVRATEEITAIGACDVVFVRSRDERLLAILRDAEARGVRIVNAPAAIARAKHRAGGMRLAAASGAPVARDYEGPRGALPFDRAVVKPRVDDGKTPPTLHDAGDPDEIIYAQEVLPSAWEHKIYLVGDEAVFAFVQRPTLEAPDKLSTRRRVEPDPILVAHARKVAAAIGLELAGVDFLQDADDAPRVTDINSNQGLHHFDDGPVALAKYLRRRIG